MTKPATPEDCDRLFAEYANRGDLDGLASLYEPGATLVMQGAGPQQGLVAIRSALADLLAMKPRFAMNVTKVVRGGDDLAALYNEYTMSATGPDGAPLEIRGKAIEIVRRQADGSWRFAIDDPTIGG